MTAIQVECDLPALLEMSGARPRGNRHDCPRCGGLRTVTHTPECFYCHKCQWKGNAVTLAKELGRDRRVCSAEYRELCQNGERADRAARDLYERAKARRFELLEELHTMNRLEWQVRDAGPDHPVTWDALALVHRRRPVVLAELTILENFGAAELLRSVSASPEEGERSLETVILRGGLCDLRRQVCGGGRLGRRGHGPSLS